MAQQPRGFYLTQIHPDPNTDIATDIDIIAIHGLDTKSPDTWIWRSKEPNKPSVNWLADSHMLPSKVGRARIFTCDWPADMFVPSDLMQRTDEEFSRRLLDAIKRRKGCDSKEENRPILFIASCLGGVILMKALTMAEGEYAFIKKATRAIIFLATPFRGTSFEDVANWAEPGLKTWASIKGHQVTTLLKNVKESFDVDELVARFVGLCLGHDGNHAYEIMTFYELGKMNLYHKVFPCLWFGAKPLVNKSSATLQIVPEPLSLNRHHQLMNKFRGPDDNDYTSVAGRIEQFLRNIRKKGPDAWISTHHYTRNTLKIERLSGDQLQIEQCYINLAIIEQPGNREVRSNTSQSSPFSLFARQKTETPDKTIQIELGTIFNERKGHDNCSIQPRRVLIRGSAGIGKTTLCKKIVFDFTHDTQSKVHIAWTGLFDRLLWIPLRNLKSRLALDAREYNLEKLFYHEYFRHEGDDGHRLAKDLWQIVKSDDSRTLFLLDGLDEVSQDLSGDASSFLHFLLNRQNVIITSRPNVSLPARLDALHLELETVGFYSDQVKDYIMADPKIKPRADEIQSFLHEHWLIQGLVRIPIQLDALCYTWEDFNPGIVPNTMTGMYKAIEQRLWKKDAVRLGKVSENNARSSHPIEIEHKVGPEIALLECLAFNGLHSDVVDFSPQHRGRMLEIFQQSDLPLDNILGKLSFLRTSDPKSKDLNYHFIHLTFQEYFAAKYFVRQWLSGQHLEYIYLGNEGNADSGSITDPTMFLQKHKYTARYDILWRFVAGLLDTKGKAAGFINEVEKEPLDLLGPTHQRLVMHCLSEISTDLPNRENLEQWLSEWLLFECKITESASLVSEVEFPEKILYRTLLDGSGNIKKIILASLMKRTILPLSVVEQASCLLEHDDMNVRWAAADALGKQSTLPEKVINAIIARLEHQYKYIRGSAVFALSQQSTLPEKVLNAMIARLEDHDKDVRGAAANALGKQSTLPEKVLNAIIARLEHQDKNIREVAIFALSKQSTLPEKVLNTMIAQLEDQDKDIREVAVYALGQQSTLPEKVLNAMIARLEDQDKDIRRAAANALGEQSTLPEKVLNAMIARLEHQDKDVRWAAVHALGKQSTLHEKVLNAMIARLEDQDKYIRRAAVHALGGQPTLYEKVLNAMIARLEDQDKYIRRAAVHALGEQPTLPEKVLNAMIARLEDQDIREVTVYVLSQQSTLPEKVLNAMIARLEDQDKNIRQVAIFALSKQSTLPEKVLNTMIAQLEDQDKNIRRAAVYALGEQSTLPEKVLNAIIARLEDHDKNIRRAAVHALGEQPTLPEKVLNAMIARLEDHDKDIRRAAANALGKQSTLPEKVLNAMIARLEDQDKDIRQAAVFALSQQSTLPEKALEAIVMRLEDQDWDVQQAAEALLRQNENFYRTLFNGPSIISIHKVLLRKSFKEHISWYIDDGHFYIQMADTRMLLVLNQQNDITAMINEAREMHLGPLLFRSP